jgi:trimethylamine:corrinoid methyltransferase-like protein
MWNHLAKLVTELDTDRIRDGAIRLLADVGMAVPSPDIARRLRAAEVRVENGRMYLPPDRTDAFFRREKAAAAAEPAEQPLRIYTGGHCLYEYAPEDHAIRRLTIARLERWTKLVAALTESGELASAGCPGAPDDCPPRLALLNLHFIAARYVKNPPLYVYSAELAPYVAEMAAALGQRLSVDGVHPISPLILGGEELELAVAMLDRGALAPVVHCAPMPTMGVTAPLDWTAAWAQSLAEAVGTALALEAMGRSKVRGSAFSTLYVADMQHGAFVFGSPEHAVVTLAEAKVNREILGKPRRAAKSINTTAKEPGAHAATEKTAHTLAALLAGYRELGSAGVLAIDEIFSPEQLIIDLDIVAHAWHIVRGVEARFAEGDVPALVREGLEAKEFFTTETTLKRFRGFGPVPRTFDRRSTGSWLTSPAPETAKAWEIAQDKIRGYTYELDETRQRELRRIIEAAGRAFGD